MAKYNLKQNYRGEDGKLYRAGEGIEVPKRAKLTIAKTEDSAGATVPSASTKLPADPTSGTTVPPPDGQ